MKKTILALSVCGLVHSASAQIHLDSGMVAFYPFTGNASDSSGNGNNGTVYGATLTTGEAGIPNTAYRFNGTSDYIEVADSPTLSPTVFSITAKVKPEGFYAGTGQGNAIVWKDSPELSAGHYALLFSDSPYDHGDINALDSTQETFYGEVGTNNGWTPAQLYYSPTITSGTWYCVIYTFDGTTINFFVDDDLKYSVAATTPLGTNTAPLGIGRISPYNPNFPFWFHGVMDDLRIYNRVLNTDEIGYYCNTTHSGIAPAQAESNEGFVLNTCTTDGILHLRALRPMSDAVITIHNAMGQLVYAGTVNALTTGAEKTLDISMQAKGIYVVDVVAGKERFVRRVVVQ